MRWFHIILTASLISISIAAATQASPPNWATAKDRATHKSVEVTVPLTAGTLVNSGLHDANNKGSDLAASYETNDRKVIGTIFLYAPTRPDPGLTFLATDHAIRKRLGAGVSVAQDEMVRVDGIANAGRRIAYVGKADAKLSGDPDGRIYSSATFFRAGIWMVKVRVTGPVSRSAEIVRNLDALVAGMTFAKTTRPFPSRRIGAPACTTAGAASGDVVITKPTYAEAFEIALTVEPIGDAGEKAPMMGDFSNLCLEREEIREGIPLLTYRAAGAATGEASPATVFLYGDAGIMLFAIESRTHKGKYFITRHSIGRTFILGRADGLPSDAQLKAILFNPDNQPAVVTVVDDHLSDPKGKKIEINCNLTIEGCAKK